MKQREKDKPGALRVWWVSHAPGTPYRVSVTGFAQAKKVLEVLAGYDLLQRSRGTKRGVVGTGGIECFSQNGDGQWCYWHQPEASNDARITGAKGAA